MAGEFKSRWERAHRSLTGLTVSQKLSAGVLVAIMIATGFWLARDAERGAMEPVLDQAFSDADVVQIANRLTEKKVSHYERDGKIYVPADRKLEVLSDLIYTDTLIGNTESGFDALVKESSLFDSPSKADKMFNHAREQMLQSIIRGFHGVRKATVLIDPTNERHINGGSITPAALVDIQTRGNEATPRQLASAAVNAVTGAVSTMSSDRVKVTIDGASYNVGSEEFTGDIPERRQQCEQAYVAKVRQLLSFIPDVLVSVSVDLNVETQELEKHTYDQSSSVKLESHAETRIDHAAPIDEADENAVAVLANAVPSLGDKHVDSPTTAPAFTENTRTDFTLFPSETTEKTRTPAGKETVLSASVVVPRTYFAQIYRHSTAKADEPTDQLLQPIIASQSDKIRRLVRNALGLKRDEDVMVEVYEDASSSSVPATQIAAPLSEQAVVLPQLSALWNHKTQWGLGVFGAMTLLMVSTMLRRGSGAMAAPQPVDPPLAASLRTPASRFPMSAASRIDFGDDEDEHEDALLLRQVRELAAARPEDAARVLRQWIYQG